MLVRYALIEFSGIILSNNYSSTHKYNVKGLGHATFWNFLPFSLNFHDDHLEFPMPSQAIYQLQFANSHPVKRITCSNVL